MAAILMGYDTECAAIGEGLARLGPDIVPYMSCLEPHTTVQGLDIIGQNHGDLGVPATLFVCGRTLTHATDAVQAAAANPLFDIQQHTYSHLLFKDQAWKDGVFRASPPHAIGEELAFTSALIERYAGSRCIGLRTPFGYYRGLRDRPDLLQLLADAGIRYVSAWGRNDEGGNPTPWVQPFWYEEEGYPDILELPFQFWLDGIWFDMHGFGNGTGFRAELRRAVDEIADQDLVYGVCFHDWAMTVCDEPGTGWVRGMLEHALERGVEVTSYTRYYERLAGSRA